MPEYSRTKHTLRVRALGVTIALIVAVGLMVSGTQSNKASAQSVDDAALQTALLQSYFISVDNFAGPVMMGGMGTPLVPTMIPPDEIMAMMTQMGQMANFDPATMPANPGMLAAIYSSGEPALPAGVTPDPMDFGTMRWDPASFDTNIATRDQAMLIMKFVEWAKFFHKGFDGENILFPTPEMEAFLSLMFTAQAMMVSNFTGQNLMAENGFITSINMDGGARTVVNDTANPFDQAAMLWALSDLMLTLNDMENYPILGALAQQVASPEMMESMMGMWDKTFEMVKANPTTDPKDAGLAIVSLVWYAAAKGDMAPLEEIISAVDGIASGLGTSETTAFEKSASIRGLLEAWRLTGNEEYLNTATSLWADLDGMWDDNAKTYATIAGASSYTYTPWDVGLVLGALSEVITVRGDGIGSDVKELATNRYLDFQTGTIVGSGFIHLPVPTPGRTGLFVSEASYDVAAGEWTVTDTRYNAAGSQYAANEMIWLEGALQGRQTGYPALPSLPVTPPSVGDAALSLQLMAGIGVIGLLLIGSGGLLIARRRV
ncbi:MAG: hypothetical protein QF898_19910 [SAR202 cluster bacterium]|nr:hypothetical protein [SAR202 cluster bacterium]MDP6511643.1 hypothetical protein [SAR202 cluster bacterium]